MHQVNHQAERLSDTSAWRRPAVAAICLALSWLAGTAVARGPFTQDMPCGGAATRSATVIRARACGVKGDGLTNDSAALLKALAAANALAPRPAVLSLRGAKVFYNPSNGAPLRIGRNVSIQMPGTTLIGGPRSTDAFVYGGSLLPQALPNITDFHNGAAVRVEANGLYASFTYLTDNKYGIWVDANNHGRPWNGIYNCTLTGMKIAGGKAAIRLTLDGSYTVIEGICVDMNFCQSPIGVLLDTPSKTPLNHDVINDNVFVMHGFDPVHAPGSCGVWVDPNLNGSYGVLGPNIYNADEFFGSYTAGPFHFQTDCSGWTIKVAIADGPWDTWAAWGGLPVGTRIIDTNAHALAVTASTQPDPTGRGARLKWGARPYFTNNIAVRLPIDAATAARLNGGKPVDYYLWSPFTMAGLDVIQATPVFIGPVRLLAVQDESQERGIDGNTGPNQVLIRIAALPGAKVATDAGRSNAVLLHWGG